MMVKNETKFHKHHLGGRGMLECVCVQGFREDFELWEGGWEHQSSVFTWRGCIAHNN